MPMKMHSAVGINKVERMIGCAFAQPKTSKAKLSATVSESLALLALHDQSNPTAQHTTRLMTANQVLDAQRLRVQQLLDALEVAIDLRREVLADPASGPLIPDRGTWFKGGHGDGVLRRRGRNQRNVEM